MAKRANRTKTRKVSIKLLMAAGFFCLLAAASLSVATLAAAGNVPGAALASAMAVAGTALVAYGTLRVRPSQGQGQEHAEPTAGSANALDLDETDDATESQAPDDGSLAKADETVVVPDDANDGSALFPNPMSNFSHPLGRHRESASMLQARGYVQTTQRLLEHSDDVFATAKDLVKTGNTIDAFSLLADLLRHCDALAHPNPPTIKPIQLTRNNRFWLGGDVSLASDETYDAVVSLEAALNLNTDMLLADGQQQNPPHLPTAEKARRVLAAASRLQPNYQGKVDYTSMAYGRLAPDGSDWAVRERLANAAENAMLPFRIVFDMRTNAEQGLVAVSLEIPRPTCFSIICEDRSGQEGLARDYAFRSALFMAKCALDALRGKAPRRAVIACHERGSNKVLLSMDVTPKDVPSMEQLCSSDVPMKLPQRENIRMACTFNWLDEVDAFIDLDDPLLDPQCYTDAVETSSKRCSALLAQATHAQRESDLGIYEGAAKRRAWANLEGRLGSTAESAVSATKELQRETKDASVQEACNRAMRALVDGTAGPEDLDDLERVFLGGDRLDEMLRLCVSAYASRNGEQVEQAVSKLAQAITPSMQIGVMDDTESVFRFFRNTAERIAYNSAARDVREVRLVPKSYYAANEMMAYLLCSLNRPDEARPYAEESVRIAPFSANAVITKARVLEEQMRVFEAIDLLNDAIPRCATVSDAALCYYRMAYLQWNIGNHAAAAASYRLCIALHTDITPQAQVELDELLDSDDALLGYSTEEALDVMEAEGVSTWPAATRRREIAKAAVLCADEKLYRSAQSLVLSLLEFVHDDAIIDVCRSFSPAE